MHHLTSELDLFASLVPDMNLVCLVATSPDHEISIFHVFGLVLRFDCLNELDSLFFLLKNFLVESLSVATETCVAV